MNTNENSKNERSRNAIYLRIPDCLMNELTQISKDTGLKPQQILLDGLKHAKSRPRAFLGEAGTKIVSAINRIGTNVNQIAKKVNQGSGRGWYDELDQIAKQLEAIKQMVGGELGYR